MDRFKTLTLLFLLLFAVWILLTGSFNAEELTAGVIISFIISILFFKQNVSGQIKLTPKALIYAVSYFFFFSYALIKSNFDVAYRVIHPALPIRPGIVKVRTSLQSKLGRAVLASSITLTPGTLTVEAKGDIFYIHWIDVQDEDIEAATHAIVSDFERYLEVIFG